MALEIHENFYQFLRLCHVPNNLKYYDRRIGVVDISGTKRYTNSTCTLYSEPTAFEKYNSSYPVTIRVGSGQRTSDTDYYLDSELSNIEKHATSYSTSWYDANHLVTWRLTAAGINNNENQISITEIGLTSTSRDSADAGSYTYLLAYEHLDTPIVVEPGAYFKVDMTINIQM